MSDTVALKNEGRSERVMLRVEVVKVALSTSSLTNVLVSYKVRDLISDAVAIPSSNRSL